MLHHPLRADHHSTSSVETAIEAVARGEFVIVTDSPDRENEGDLIFAAEFATPEAIAFMVRHTSGIICVALSPRRVAVLELPQMVERNDDSMGTAFTVSVDARIGTTTGISARDRARTILALADPSSKPSDLRRPGHIFPLLARPDGVLERPGHTEAAVDLAMLAGCTEAGVLCELVDDDGEPMRGSNLVTFAMRHGIVLTSINELAAYRRRNMPPTRKLRTS
jgi:3,4-dihydroxy 2-butanone 4-phosphate synthase/GTP cyclohydrolase II